MGGAERPARAFDFRSRKFAGRQGLQVSGFWRLAFGNSLRAEGIVYPDKFPVCKPERARIQFAGRPPKPRGPFD